eukprot:COSAG01_NODE_2664_length_7291_cov_4.395996_8_plen_138_part_00
MFLFNGVTTEQVPPLEDAPRVHAILDEASSQSAAVIDESRMPPDDERFVRSQRWPAKYGKLLCVLPQKDDDNICAKLNDVVIKRCCAREKQTYTPPITTTSDPSLLLPCVRPLKCALHDSKHTGLLHALADMEYSRR